METFGRCFLLALLLALTTRADWSVKSSTTAPPDSVAAEIRGALANESMQVSRDNTAVMDLWLRKEVPLKGSAASLNSIPEAVLLGVIALHTPLQDYKGNEVSKGIYTARFAQQPQDGDHLGTAEYTTFLVLVPAAADQGLDAFSKYTPLVNASGKIIPSGHPAVLNLRPLSSAAAAPTISEPAAEHRAVRLKLNGKPASGEKVEIAFDLVFEGQGGMH